MIAAAPEDLIAEMRAEHQAELARARHRLLEVGETPARIEVILRHARGMLDEQLACAERRLGLAPAVVVH